MRILISVAILLAICLGGAAFWRFAREERRQALESWRVRLSAMADDRKAAIEIWLADAQSDAQVLLDFPTLQVILGQSLPAEDEVPYPEKSGATAHLDSLFAHFAGAEGYAGIYLLDAGGRTLVSTPGAPPLPEACRNWMADPDWKGVGARLFAEPALETLVVHARPARSSGESGGAAAIFLLRDPGLWLYPLLAREPAPTKTGEVLIMQREGRLVRYLAPLRHSPEPVLGVTVPLDAPNLASRDALEGREAFGHYRDYRDSPVLAATRRVAGTNWGLVAKVDQEEALAPYRSRVAWTGAVGLLLFLLLGAVLWAYARHERLLHLEALNRRDERYRLLREEAGDPLFFVRPDGIVLEANRAAEEMYGYGPGEMAGLSVAEIQVSEERSKLPTHLQRALSGGAFFEAVHLKRDGTAFPVEVRSRPARLGDQILLISTVRDVSERKRAEEALRQSEERLRSLGDNLPDSYIYLYTHEDDGTPRFLYASAGLERIHGITVEEVLHDAGALHGQTDPDQLKALRVAEAESRKTLSDFAMELRMRTKGGTWRWLQVRSRPRKISDGRILWDGVATDITARKAGEEALREERDFTAAVLDSLPGVVYCFDERFRFRRWNRELERVTGYGGQEIAGLSPLDLFAEDQKGLLRERIGEVFQTGSSSVEADLLSKDGTRTPYFFTGAAVSIEGRPHLVGAGIDLSERKRSEEEVLRLNARLERLIGAVSALAGARDMAGVLRTVRKAARDVAGADGATVVLRDGEECHYVDEDAISPLWKGRRFPLAACISGWSILNRETVVIEDVYNDSRIPVEVYRPTFVRSLAMVPIGKENPVGAIGNYWARNHVPDSQELRLLETLAEAAAVTIQAVQTLEELEQKVQERTRELLDTLKRLADSAEQVRLGNALLQEKETMLRLALEGAGAGTWGWDSVTGRVALSGMTRRVLSLASEGDLTVQTFLERFSPPGQEELYRQMGEALLHGETLSVEAEVNVEGARRWLLLRGKGLKQEEEEERRVFGIALDVTERREAEEALRRLAEEIWVLNRDLRASNAELEAFSYSVSHDLRAPLRALDGFSQALAEDFGETLGERGKDYLRRIRSAAQRMALLIDDLLQLSRVSRAELRREEVDLSALARSVLSELLRREPEREVAVVVEEGLKAEGDPRLLRVVLENLLGNAFKYTSRKEKARIVFRREGMGFAVEDDGAGFDMRFADKLFIPFQRLHASKDFPGTGVGLALVRRIVRRHGGEVGGRGEPDRGALFFFTLGAAGEGAVAADPPPEICPRPPLNLS
ncbi:MAG: PAS domain S-box protein [Acidobacteriota bacterium]